MCHLFTLVALLSLLLCVATMVLWLRSYTVVDQWWLGRFKLTSAGVGNENNWTIVSFPSFIWIDNSQDDSYPSPLEHNRNGWAINRFTSGRSLSYDGPRLRTWLGHKNLGTAAIGGWNYVEYGGVKVELGRLRFGSVVSDRHGCHTRVLLVPDWFLVLLTSVFPLYYTYGKLRRHRRVGLCANCGYDLRGTPDQCPECGSKTKREDVTI
jgi:hypothetical protein